MKPLIFATLAMFSLAAPTFAQTQTQTAAATVQTNPGTPANQTGGGDRHDPEPHIYKRGEHVSPSYGPFDVVDNWSQFHLAKPPTDSHWVKYGDNYLLVKTDDGLITEIIKAS